MATQLRYNGKELADMARVIEQAALAIRQPITLTYIMTLPGAGISALVKRAKEHPADFVWPSSDRGQARIIDADALIRAMFDVSTDTAVGILMRDPGKVHDAWNYLVVNAADSLLITTIDLRRLFATCKRPAHCLARVGYKHMDYIAHLQISRRTDVLGRQSPASLISRVKRDFEMSGLPDRVEFLLPGSMLLDSYTIHRFTQTNAPQIGGFSNDE